MRALAPSSAMNSTAPLRLTRNLPANGLPVITETQRSTAVVLLYTPHWPAMGAAAGFRKDSFLSASVVVGAAAGVKFPPRLQDFVALLTLACDGADGRVGEVRVDAHHGNTVRSTRRRTSRT